LEDADLTVEILEDLVLITPGIYGHYYSFSKID
jgi:hypothetical protein